MHSIANSILFKKIFEKSFLFRISFFPKARLFLKIISSKPDLNSGDVISSEKNIKVLKLKKREFKNFKNKKMGV